MGSRKSDKEDVRTTLGREGCPKPRPGVPPKPKYWYLTKRQQQSKEEELARKAAEKVTTVTNAGQPLKHRAGSIPKYLEKRQQEWKEEELARQETQKSASIPSPHAPSPRTRPGVVPKYLTKRQQQWKDEELARKEAEKAANIPPGHVAMSESERQETLANLKSTYDSLVNELNRVPISVDTIRVRRYKQKLETELSKLEDAMKLFSRPQVFVKLDQQAQ